VIRGLKHKVEDAKQLIEELHAKQRNQGNTT
jgi:hypothetical protein